MTDEEIFVAMAQAEFPNDWDTLPRMAIPRYLDNLNPIARLEAKLDESHNGLGSGTYYRNALCQICGSHAKAVHATARQRCEAFLRTIGKWKEVATT